MTRRLAASLALVALTTASLLAADFWETKPFGTWTDMETQQVVTDSPWAKKVTLTPAGGRAGGPQDLQVVIGWRTALPMKQALVRQQIGLGAAVPAASRELLDRKEGSVVVAVDGLPARLAGSTANIRADSYIRIGDKARLGPEEALATPSGNNLVLALVFPRGPVALEDKNVEFGTKVGAYEIKGIFPLKDMVFHGRIEM